MTTDILLVFGVLAATIVLFVSDRLRVDVIAILVMVSLPWLGLLEPREALSGLASNAVVSVIAIMILGRGIDRTGIMIRITAPILRLAGDSERRLTALVSGTVGLVSAFMQNIGAAALFLPASMRLSKRRKLPASRLLMPMGFAAILGGTLTMVASSPLIVLNDLLRQGGQGPFGLFSVTPIGLALLVAGIAYFLLFGRFVLSAGGTGEKETADPQEELKQAWGLLSSMYCVEILPGSDLNGKELDEIALWDTYNLHAVVLREAGHVHYAPWRHTRIHHGQKIGLLGSRSEVERFAADHGLRFEETRENLLEELQSVMVGGFAEIVVHPRSSLVGKSLREIALRKKYEIEPILLLSGGSVEHHDFSDQKLKPGDTLIVHGNWERLKAIREYKDLILLTPIEETEEPYRSKQVTALLCFAGAIGLALGGFSLSISLLTGAVAMVLLKVIPMDAAYRAVDWKTVFLLAGLIPLGIAMEKTGAARFLAEGMAGLLSGSHPLLLLAAAAILATVFSLFMSNVAATVLLVPLVMTFGLREGIDPRGLALLVAVCASNSFLIPTHQVNALLMSAGGYRSRDYFRAGGFMTVIFLAVSVGLVYLFYL